MRATIAAAVACVLLAASAGTARADDGDPVPLDPVPCAAGDAVTNTAVECGGVEDVPSLDPILAPAQTASTAATELTSGTAGGTTTTAGLRRLLPSGCHLHNEAVFYAAGDWLRLAHTLAAEASPCSDFFISVPPLVADKTTFRPLQGRALHEVSTQVLALAEVHFAAWQTWLRHNGKTWYEAGVEARRRLDAAGYFGWAVNELPSSVRQGQPGTRANVAAFLDGLYDGDGTRPPSRGVVFIVGVSQRTSPLSVYKTNLGRWHEDALFWGAVRRTVRFWAQEVYGDTRVWGVAAATREERIAYLNEYLQHQIALARGGGATMAAAREFLEGAFTPLGNAAWRWDFGFGNTMVSAQQMQMYVSEQAAAMREFVQTSPYGARSGRVGFAWAQRSSQVTGIPQDELVASTGAIASRLAQALRYAYAKRGGTTLDGCGRPGDRVWCAGAVDDATFYDGWKDFTFWP